MSIKSACLVLVCLILSCSEYNDPEPIEEPQDNVNEQDLTAPVIDLPEIADIIEVQTELNFEISDDSEQVMTTISVNGTEVFHSSDKSFTFSLDPFDYPIGSSILSIVSTDANGNESDAYLDFELKKLLCIYPDAFYNFDENTIQSYLSIHKSNGELAYFRKVESADDGIFYADDNFERQNFTFTQYLIGKEAFPIDLVILFSNAAISPGTVFSDAAERAIIFNSTLFKNQHKTISIASASPSVCDGFDAHILKVQPLVSDFEHKLFYSSDAGDPKFFLYSFFGNTDLIDSYRYTFIEDPNKLVYSPEDFNALTNSTQIQIPSGMEYELEIFAYEDLTAYDDYRYRKIYNKKENVGGTGTAVDIPIIGEYKNFQKRLKLKLDDKTAMETEQLGIDEDFEIPTLEVQRMNNQLSITGEYDYSRLQFSRNFVNGQNSNTLIFTWTYLQRPDEVVAIPYKDFELPDVILEEFSTFNLTQDPDLVATDELTCSVITYDNHFVYENTVFNQAYNRNELGDRFLLIKNLK